MSPALRVLLAALMLAGLAACSFGGRVHLGDFFLAAGGGSGHGLVTSFGHHVSIVLH